MGNLMYGISNSSAPFWPVPRLVSSNPPPNSAQKGERTTAHVADTLQNCTNQSQNRDDSRDELYNVYHPLCPRCCLGRCVFLRNGVQRRGESGAMLAAKQYLVLPLLPTWNLGAQQRYFPFHLSTLENWSMGGIEVSNRCSPEMTLISNSKGFLDRSCPEWKGFDKDASVSVRKSMEKRS